jgi:hypothetical protein
MIMANPLAFRPGPVTFWTTLVYLGLLVPILYVHETVPPAPDVADPYKGLNLTQAWLDLARITQRYHPYNSRNNDDVRDYLLLRIQEVLDGNEIPWSVDGADGAASSSKESVKPFIF